ncbi:hypothetical protein [Rugosimonospora acidiphila]|uniref:hypothetical protein n=1 Tax=Rugosimonospora acidiphila TaxID=556531 RepID=UPI0031EFAA7C
MQSSQEPQRDRNAASRAPEHQPGASVTRIVDRLMWIIGVPLVALFALTYGWTQLGPAARAAHREGSLGTFHVISKICQKDCRLRGDFVSDDGTITRDGVDLYGGIPHDADAGDSLRALDTGDPYGVYPPSGSRQWVWSTLSTAGGGAGLLWWVWRYPLRAPGRRSTAALGKRSA